jgi:Ca2+-binding RTX toxin-like protein
VQTSVSYTLANYLENLTLTGSGAINGTGNSAANTLVGNNQVNILNGLGGADWMEGGAGNDIYVVDNVGDVTREYNTQGTDLVQTSVSYTLANYLENLTLTGSGAINGTGNSATNLLLGNSAKNTLKGDLGTDTIYGGLGQDLLYGGSDSVRDIFDFNALAESKVGTANRDKIYNFVTGKDDIDLSGIDANTRASGDQGFKFGGTTKTANGIWYEKLGSDLLVHIDNNGDKISDMDVQLIGVSKIVGTDFVL